MQRTASAVWSGGLKDGKGTISTQSGVLSDAQYSVSARFESGKGTNPEELVAAAHAGCYTMALSAHLGTMHFTPQSLRTTATLSFEKIDSLWTISKIHLDVVGRVSGISAEAFQSAAQNAKSSCPISRALKTEITMTANLEQAA